MDIPEMKYIMYYQMVYILANNGVGTGLTSISYFNSYGIDKTLSVSFEISFLLVPTCSETVEIYTAEDFVEKIDGTYSGYKYYILMNDIDLSDYVWLNRDNSLFGVFDGNGHTISGVGAKTTYDRPDQQSGDDQNLYVGLFSSVSGVVKNLTVQADYRITYNSNNTGFVVVPIIYIGGIAACASSDYYNYNYSFSNYAARHAARESVYENVTVDLSVSLILNGEDEYEYQTEIYAGGLCGVSVLSAKDVNVTTDVAIMNNNCPQWTLIGGLYGGYSDSESCYIENANVIFACSINGSWINACIGGLAGNAKNCVISGASVKSEVTLTLVSFGAIFGGVFAGCTDYFELYGVTSSMAIDIKFTDDGNSGYGYNEYCLDLENCYIDENCSAEITVTVN